jgi:uncharacterized protein DUF3574
MASPCAFSGQRTRLPRSLLLLAACAACAPRSALSSTGTSVLPGTVHCSGAAASAVRDLLYFGHNIPGGTTVPDSAWRAFVVTDIIPRFPDGFTLWDASGNWRGATGRPESEHTTVFELVHPPSRRTDSLVRVVALAYKSQFAQEAVLHEQSPVCSDLL